VGGEGYVKTGKYNDERLAEEVSLFLSTSGVYEQEIYKMV